MANADTRSSSRPTPAGVRSQLFGSSPDRRESSDQRSGHTYRYTCAWNATRLVGTSRTWDEPHVAHVRATAMVRRPECHGISIWHTTHEAAHVTCSAFATKYHRSNAVCRKRASFSRSLRLLANTREWAKLVTFPMPVARPQGSVSHGGSGHTRGRVFGI